MEDNVRFITQPKPLSPDQVIHWEQQLVVAERMRDCALRMLGRVGVESEVSHE